MHWESWTFSRIPAEPEEAWSVTRGHQADMQRGTGVVWQFRANKEAQKSLPIKHLHVAVMECFII